MSRDFPYRKNIRLLNFDYSSANAYFVTICTHFRECLFGEVLDSQMLLNDLGKIVEATWHDLPNHISGIELDKFIVMPNHIHGIIAIVGAGSKPARAACVHNSIKLVSKPAHTRSTNTALSEIVRQLKTFSARRINKTRKQPMPVWQRNYYEHVIRDELSFNRIREYIINNPLQWEFDENNPANKGGGMRGRAGGFEKQVGGMHGRAGLEPAPTVLPTTLTNHKSSQSP